MAKVSGEISIIPISGIPEITSGDDLVKTVLVALGRNGISLRNGDVIVFAQKIISKAEDRIVRLDDVKPSPFALTLSKEVSKDPRLVEIILGETTKIIKMDQRKPEKGRLIVETRGGVISANAGVDASNVSGGDAVTLLPVDSDLSAEKLASGFRKEAGAEVAVIITDTVGRPWREGLVDIAIGCSGIKPLKDYSGRKDSKGLVLSATVMAVADEIASAAGLVMEKADSVPVVIVRGYGFEKGEGGARELIRNPEDDLFR
ncbi:MAG TPA: coenzyme F420-0:L-glutamate ligase [Thermodesulfobacteriota bacterium]|nr:coenzyme F420-0:L-glutamate ligase [Thermodesulfobacteriota bacterium]